MRIDNMKWTHFYLSEKNPRPEARGIAALISRALCRIHDFIVTWGR